MSLDLALWSALAALGLLGLRGLCRLRLALELALAGSTLPQHPGLHLEAALSLGPARLELVREAAGGRLLGWRLRLFGRGLLEGAWMLGARAAPAANDGPRAPQDDERTPRRWRLAMRWPDGARWLLQQGPRLRITRLDGRVAVGLEDPASTGMAYGLLCSLHALAVTGAQIEIRPVFDRAQLDGEARAALDLQLLPLLCSAAWLVVTHLRRARTERPGPTLAGAALPSSPGAR